MKTINEIYNSIKSSFFNGSKSDIQSGTVLDFLTLAVSSGVQETLNEIENNKNPYIFSRLLTDTNSLDEFGYTLNIPREAEEPNDKYFFRIINSRIINQSSNSTAIESALLNLKYSSYARYMPLTYGAGTGTVYVIPKSYDDETKKNALDEVNIKIKKAISQASYIDCKIPSTLKVDLIIYIHTEEGDLTYIKQNLFDKIKNYINSIPPGDYLEAGEINKIGINESSITYFSLDKIVINDISTNEIKILQTINEKFIVNDIVWVVAE